jgi:streptomycin 6-kinase
VTWAADLGSRVGCLALRWDLAVGEPFAHGASSVTYRATTSAGVPAVLKVSPDELFLAEQVAVLRLFEPSGRVPRVLAEDTGAMLLTEIRPGTPVCDLPAQPGCAAAGALLAALHSVPVPSRDAVSGGLRDWTSEFLDRARRRLTDPVLAAHLRQSDFDLAIAERDRLLAQPHPVALVHGDLHLANMLVGEPGLVAIDPKASLGDPCFDAVDYVAAGVGRDGVDTRLAGLAEFGYDPARMLGWTRVAVPALVPGLLNRGEVSSAEELLELLR